MRLVESAEDALFRKEVRAWLEANVIRESRPHQTGEAQRAFDVAWRRRQYDGGWGHIAWPEAYGGRVLSDVSGPFFTVVAETQVESLSEWEARTKEYFSIPEFGKWFARMQPLVESGRREFYSVEQ